MYTSDALLDLHARGHVSLRRLLEHGATLPLDDLNRHLPGFGYPSVRLQVIHVIGAQHYWMGVLQGVLDVEDRDDRYPTMRAVEVWRSEVEAATRDYLKAASVEELNTPRPMTPWGGRQVILAPARVFLRTLTHIYHHQGQVVAMYRLLGKPAAGLDFPMV